MKNSTSRDIKKKTLQILGELSVRLDTTQISNAFDQALEEYIGQYREPDNHAEFNREISRFIQIVYGTGMKPGLTLTTQEANAKAISFLNGYCNSQGSRGYEAAYLDAVYSNEAGIGDVCFQLFQTIREIEIKKYQDYVYATTINPSDWRLHIDIVRGITELYGEYLSPLIRESPPERFSCHYRDIIEIILTSDDYALKICSGLNCAF